MIPKAQSSLFLMKNLNNIDWMGKKSLDIFFKFYLKYVHRDHPFKTSACSRGGGVKNLPNLPTDSTKKLPTVGGWGSKKCKNLPTS